MQPPTPSGPSAPGSTDASASRRFGRPVVVAVVASAAVAVVAAVTLVWFAPQTAWQNRRVNEAAPATRAVAATAGTPSGAAGGDQMHHDMHDQMHADMHDQMHPDMHDAAAPAATPTTGAAAVAEPSGMFRSVEHDTKGSVRLVTLADGTRVVRIEGLDTTNGPDLHVVLTSDASGRAVGNAYTDLGRLKANQGEQNYAVPAGVDPSRLAAVAIWCKRFDATFGVAPLSA